MVIIPEKGRKMNKVFIIAEVGVNHNGDMDRALDMVDRAAEAGADAVKFQTFQARALAVAQAPKAEYQKWTTDGAETQVEMLRRLELDRDNHHALIERCRTRNIEFLSAGFDLASLDLLNDFGLRRFKVPSGEITNLPYLRRVASFGKTIILSTGMATLPEIGAALGVLEQGGVGRRDVTLLHCNTAYPTPMGDVNLRAMQCMRKEFGVAVGYSDHTLGIEVAIAAVALGAVVVEKHFTLDRDLPGPDHRASLVPEELFAMISAIRNIEEALGDGVKRPTDSEVENICVARKSLVAAKVIRAGEPFTDVNVTAKRPGFGLSPMRWDEIMGRIAHRDFVPDEMIEL